MSGFRRVKALNRGIGKEKRRSFRLAAAKSEADCRYQAGSLRSPERGNEAIEEIKSQDATAMLGFVIDSLD